MSNSSSIRIKPVKHIQRNIKTIRRIYEIIMSMPNRNVYITEPSHPLAHIRIYAFNSNGVCIYQFEGKKLTGDHPMINNLHVLQEYNNKQVNI